MRRLVSPFAIVLLLSAAAGAQQGTTNDELMKS